MKYIITAKNPIFKEGLHINKTQNTPFGVHYFESDKSLHISDDILNGWFNNDYIKEVEEKEFTKSDVIDFGLNMPLFCGGSIEGDISDYYNDWLKQRDK